MNWKKILIGKWSWKRPFISFASIYALLGIVAVFFADRILFIPPPASYSASYPGLGYLKTTEEESIAYLHLPAAKGMPTLLYSHGNAEDLADSQPIYDELHARGMGVFAYDYPGYGVSTGTPNEASTQRAILTCWKHLTASGVAPSSLIITGRSVGGGPSVWLASQVDAAGLILISPFKSVFTTAFDLPFPLFPRDRFPNLQRIRSFGKPLLVIHGEDDEIIPVGHGRKLVESCPSQEKKFLGIADAGHNDLFEEGDEQIFSAMSDFVERVKR